MSPSSISLFFSSFSRSFPNLLCKRSSWKERYSSNIRFNERVSGLPLAMASIFTGKLSSSLVFLYKMFLIRSISALFFSSRTIRMPCSPDWFEISVISVIFFSSQSCATSCINLLMPAPIIVYGISVTTNLSLSLFPSFFSKTSFPRRRSFPCPVA